MRYGESVQNVDMKKIFGKVLIAQTVEQQYTFLKASTNKVIQVVSEVLSTIKTQNENNCVTIYLIFFMADINRILGITESYNAPAKIMEILRSEERDIIFHEFLEAFNHDISFDWFHGYFQEEHADRTNKKQDFTPMSIGNLLARITDDRSSSLVYDVCSGTGGLTITKWWETASQYLPWQYNPEDHFYTCVEMSERALPFLLLNLLIRGMNATVYYGDVLENQYSKVYHIINKANNPVGFSSLAEINY
ncbi:methylase [Elizabethkingia anophelis]|nr:methylase [Elizabethkingia anophelis]MDV3894553.1 methylase [Elizabethkingia anophelis]MDV3914562.1 methylase [Elizabethkingia anophelis]MDV3920690.1 methylase [Elizabethkingia anophelis]MDV3959223.1 methylase [Elizabethkingia anophelis]